MNRDNFWIAGWEITIGKSTRTLSCPSIRNHVLLQVMQQERERGKEREGKKERGRGMEGKEKEYQLIVNVER